MLANFLRLGARALIPLLILPSIAFADRMTFAVKGIGGNVPGAYWIAGGTVRLLLLVVAFAWAGVVNARAPQIIPTGVEYSNDSIEQGGKRQACIVTVAIISPPAPEIVNFQFMAIAGQLAFKITAGD